MIFAKQNAELFLIWWYRDRKFFVWSHGTEFSRFKYSISRKPWKENV